MPRKQVHARTFPLRLKSWGKRIATLLAASVLLTGLDSWVAARAFPKDAPPGFGFGVLHGAIMPLALPSLLIGREVEIYATNNSGRSYKLGYIVGINLCGLVFFGSAFWRLGNSYPSNRQPEVDPPSSLP